MGKNSRPSFQKRAKEKARQDRRKEKDARRLETRARREVNASAPTGEDPDIAGIVPGPQPVPPDFDPPPARRKP